MDQYAAEFLKETVRNGRLQWAVCPVQEQMIKCEDRKGDSYGE